MKLSLGVVIRHFPLKSARRPKQSGFVLASTLWVVAALFLIVAGFENYISSELVRAQQLREGIRQSVDLQSTEQAVRYMLITHRQTLAGVDLNTADLNNLRNDDGLISLSPVGGELRLDGQVYRGVGGVLFSIQDESGLIPLGSASTFALESYLRAQGIEEADILKYRDRLIDYWDIDDFRRLNGAETNAYERATIAAPRNDFLRSRLEVEKVLGWGELLNQLVQASNDCDTQEAHAGIRLGQIIKSFTASRDGTINPNTMPVELLDQLGVDSAAFISKRNLAAFRDAASVKSYAPGFQNWSDEGFRFLVGSKLILELWVEGSSRSQIIGLELSPFNLRGPVRERYRYSSIPPVQPRFARADSKHVFQQLGFVSTP